MGINFPTSLRELLFLAGQSCYVLDYGLYDTQEEMQNEIREDSAGNVISRPFFVIDIHNGSFTFLFVYLDEGGNDPLVYQAHLGTYENPSFESLQSTLSTFVNARINYLERGVNPF